MISKHTAVTPGIIRRLFVRISRDSGFTMEATRVAHFVADMLGITAMQVWAVIDLDNMTRIANGTHPCIENPEYR